MPLPDLLPVFNALPGANMLLSPEWVIVAASDDFLAATLSQREVIVGKYLFDPFPENPETTEDNGMSNVRASLMQVMATKQPHEMPPQHYDVPDPARPGYFVERHWLPRHTPVLDADGQVQFIIQSVQDVTAHRLAERQLRESRASEQAARAEADRQRNELHSFVEHAPVAVAVYRGPEYRVELANATTLAIWGRSLPDVLHRPVFEVLPEAAAPEVVAIFDQVYATGSPYTAHELPTTIHRNGQPEVVYWNFVFQPEHEADGRVSGILSIGTEATEQVKVRRQVQALNEQLSVANEELRESNEELEARVSARTMQLQQARQRAEHERQRLERLFMQAPAAICILSGPELVFELVNPIYQRFFPERRLLGKPLREALPELADHAANHTMRQVFDTGEAIWQQALHVPLARTDDGELEDRYFNYIQQPRYDEQGRIDGVLVFGFEVTELVQAQQQAQALQAEVLAVARHQVKERETFYQIFEQTPAAICIQRGPEHRYEYVNAAYQAFFPGREFIGRAVADVLPETVDSGVVALLDRVYQTGETYFGEELPLLIAQPEGPPQWMYFTFTYQAMREHGEIVGISTFAYNVADQVLARQRVEEATAELRLLAAHAPAFLFRTDAAGHIAYFNDAWFEWGGQDRSQLASLDEGWQIVHPDDLPALQAEFQAAVAAGQAWESAPYRMRRRDGQYRWVFSRTQPHRGPDGAVAGHSGITFEAHEQVELQHQLTRTNNDLDNFIYTASHDLKAPIANIEGLLTALELELPKVDRVGDVPTMLKLMQSAVERFKRTIAHLTDLTRLQKEHDQPPHQVALDPLIEEVRLDLTPLILETQARVVVDVQACRTISFSEKNLRSIVYNLLSNALKYCHPERQPEVRISCRSQGSYLVLEVQDNGLGLDLARERQLFAMFQRLHTHVEGSGIGLYMVKKIIDNAGGRIEVQSQLGQGSTFSVYFPR
jgi:PAS domain S-box-containing protein